MWRELLEHLQFGHLGDADCVSSIRVHICWLVNWLLWNRFLCDDDVSGQGGQGDLQYASELCAHLYQSGYGFWNGVVFSYGYDIKLCCKLLEHL